MVKEVASNNPKTLIYDINEEFFYSDSDSSSDEDFYDCDESPELNFKYIYTRSTTVYRKIK